MKTIRIDLFDPDSVKEAVKEIQAEKREWKRKAKEATRIIAEELANRINENLFNIELADDLIDVKTHQQVKSVVGLEAKANGTMVTVYGENVVFVEFGAGIYHNQGVNNPLSETVEFETNIGSYGKGHGLQPYWFVAHNLISRGTPASMPIYKAIETIKPMIPTLVRRVFV